MDKNKISTAVFYLIVLLFIVAFNFSDNPPGGWQPQFLPFLNDRPLRDMIFVDSLVGYAITGDNTVGDTNYIIKTSNSGNNWIF